MNEFEPRIYETLRAQAERTPEEIKEGLKVDFERLLKNLNELEKKFSGLQEKTESDKSLDALKTLSISKEKKKEERELLKKIWENTIKRIETETDAFSDWEDTGMKSGLINGLNKGQYKVPIRFIRMPLSIYLRDKIRHKGKFRTEGRFRNKGIEFYQKPPDFLDIWLTLIEKGPAAGMLLCLDHELIHALQEVETIGLAMAVLKMPGENRALGEMHAYKSSNAICLRRPLTSKLIKHIQEGYKVKNLDQLISAADSIDKLKALGLNDREIGQLVAKAFWIEKNATWYPLDAKAAELSSQYNLENEDVENLVLADRMERKIQSLKAQIIALEEMIQAIDSLKELTKEIHSKQ